MIHWVLDPGSSRARDTKYWRTMDLYWYIKTFVGKVLQDKDADHEEILIQLAEMKKQLQEINVVLSSCTQHNDAPVNGNPVALLILW
jgi:hypothetical protein